MPRKKKSNAWIWIAFLIFLVALGSGYFVFKFRKQVERSLGDFTRKASPITEALKFEHVFSNYTDGILGSAA
jgi:lysozyme